MIIQTLSPRHVSSLICQVKVLIFLEGIIKYLIQIHIFQASSYCIFYFTHRFTHKYVNNIHNNELREKLVRSLMTRMFRNQLVTN